MHVSMDQSSAGTETRSLKFQRFEEKSLAQIGRGGTSCSLEIWGIIAIYLPREEYVLVIVGLWTL